MQIEGIYLMAYLTTIDLVQGDRLPEIQVSLKDSNTAAAGRSLDPDDPTSFSPINIASGSVRMRLRKLGETTIKETLLGTITNGSSGDVTFLFGENTLSEAGLFEGEIEFTNADGRTQTVVDLLKFKVRAQFG